MDEIKWEAILAGNVESLADALVSSSTSRRVRALHLVREKNGTNEMISARPGTRVNWPPALNRIDSVR
jgi:hypothetical protein